MYFEARPSPAERDALAQLARAAAGGGAQPFALQALPPTDWVAKSLRELSPVRAGRFLVHGRHDRSRALPNDIAIEIDAGLAFGTGHHGTTAGCLIAIDRLAGRRPIVNALDLGTGSGVLAIAIARRAKAAVVAGDIDPVAVAVARDNARLNGVASRVTTVVATGFGARAIRAHAPYDLIVANILAAPLVALANDVRRNLAPGGSVILSGLLTTQRRRVAAMYRCQGLRPTDAIVIGGWATLVLRR
ncbi:MAG: 50S ribosomal protein L11 methyltransferase [Bauldia sp.]|nr:50S ribosomal protein L11 methyltransferase [Bauldia sp.]